MEALDWLPIIPRERQPLPFFAVRQGAIIPCNISGMEELTSAIRETGVSRHNGGPVEGPP